MTFTPCSFCYVGYISNSQSKTKAGWCSKKCSRINSGEHAISFQHLAGSQRGSQLVFTPINLSLQTGPMLVTHWGLSGPVVLRLSAWGARELHQCNYQGMMQLKYDFHQIDNWGQWHPCYICLVLYSVIIIVFSRSRTLPCILLFCRVTGSPLHLPLLFLLLSSNGLLS